MAKIVLAGPSNCPYYAKCELLADRLQVNLPNFSVHKEVLQPDEWSAWVQQKCASAGWAQVEKSPLIWRELVDRGGKGLLIGGSNEFQEYVKQYYAITSKEWHLTDELLVYADENVGFKNQEDAEQAVHLALTDPTKVALLNATSDIAYSLFGRFASGEVYGTNRQLALGMWGHDLDELEILKKEAEDISSPHLRRVTTHEDMGDAISDSAFILILEDIAPEVEEDPTAAVEEQTTLPAGAPIATPAPERENTVNRDGDEKKPDEKKNKEFLSTCNIKKSSEENVKEFCSRFERYAASLAVRARPDVRVMIGGNGPLHLAAEIIQRGCPGIIPTNIVFVAADFENTAKSVVAKELKVKTSDIRDLVVWGAPSSCCVPDYTACRVRHHPGAFYGGPEQFSRVVDQLVYEKKWLEGYSASVLSRVSCGNLQRAHAIFECAKYWLAGVEDPQIFSLGVFNSTGIYGFPKDRYVSLPVIFHPNGRFNIVQDLALSPRLNELFKLVVKQLDEDHEIMWPSPKPPTPTPLPAVEEPVEVEPEPAIVAAEEKPEGVTTDEVDEQGAPPPPEEEKVEEEQ